jgi:hypothetical protein
MDDPALRCPARHQFHHTPGSYVITYHHGGQVGDADPGDDRMTHCQQVIGDHPWRMANHRAGTVGAKQFPLIFTLRHAQCRLGKPLRSAGDGGVDRRSANSGWPTTLWVLVISLADFGQRAVAAGSIEQAHAQSVFKLGDTSTELGLGHVQRPTGRGETAMFDHLGEVIEGVEVFHHRSPNRTLRLIFAV